MEWTAWNNGSHNKTGAGYGLRVPITDRNKYFKRAWGTVTLELPISKGYKKVCVHIDKDSFWSDECRELISKEIGQWLQSQGLAPWLKKSPPKFKVTSLSPRNFRLV